MKSSFKYLMLIICLLIFFGCGDKGEKELEQFNNIYNETFNVINNSFNSTGGMPLDSSISELFNDLNNDSNNTLSKNEWQNTSTNVVSSYDKIAKGIISYCLENKGEEEVLGKVWKLSGTDNIIGKIEIVENGYICKYIENDNVYNMIKCIKQNDGVMYEVIISSNNSVTYFSVDNFSNGVILFQDNYISVYSSMDSIGYISTDKDVINEYINNVSDIKNITNIKSELKKIDLEYNLDEFIEYVGINLNVEWSISDGVLYGYNGTDSVITIPSEVTKLSNNFVLSSTVEKLIIPNTVVGIDGDINEFNIYVENENRLKEIVVEGSTLFKVIDGKLYTSDGKTLLYITDSLSSKLDLRCDNISSAIYREAVFKTLSNVKEIYLNATTSSEIQWFFEYLFRCNELSGNNDIILDKVVIDNYTNNFELFFEYKENFIFKINKLILNGDYSKVKIDDSTFVNDQTYGVIQNIEINDNAKIVIGSTLSGISSLVISQNGDYGCFDNLKSLIIKEGVTNVFFDSTFMKNNCVVEVPSTIKDFNVNMLIGKETLTIKIPFTQNVFERLGLYNNLHMSNYEIENHVWYGGNIEYANDSESIRLDQSFPYFDLIDDQIYINGYFGNENVIDIPSTLYGKKVSSFVLTNKVFDGRDYVYVDKFNFDELILPKTLTSFNIEYEETRFNINKISFDGSSDEFKSLLIDESLFGYIYSFTNTIICNNEELEKPVNNVTYIYKIDNNEFKIYADFENKSYEFEYIYNGKTYKAHLINKEGNLQNVYLYDEDVSVNFYVNDQNLPYSLDLISINVDGKDYYDLTYKTNELTYPLSHEYIEFKNDKTSCEEEIKVYEKCAVCDHIGGIIRVEKAKGHTYESKHVAANCTDYEHILFSCTECEYYYQEVLGNVIGDHKYEEYEIKEPTCNNDGYHILKCDYCNGTTQGELIPKTEEHKYGEDGLCTECYQNHKLFDFSNSSIFGVKDTSITELVIPETISTTITYFQISTLLPNLKKIIIKADLKDFLIIESDEIILPELEEIVLESTNSKLFVKDGILYNKETKEMLYIPYMLKGDVEVLDGVKVLKRFDGRSLITKITIPESVEVIETNSFKNCTSLKEAVINANITNLPSQMFLNCTSLTKVKLPNNLETIEHEAFGNTSIEELDLPVSVNSFHMGLVNCNTIKKIIIDNNSQYFYESNSIIFTKENNSIAFVNPGFNGTLEIPEGSTSVLSGLEKLNVKKIILPNSINNILYTSFSEISTLEELVVNSENTITNQGGKVILPSSLKKLSVYANNLMAFDIKDVYEISIIGGSTIDYGYSYVGYSNTKVLNLPKSIEVFNAIIFASLEEINYDGTLDDWSKVTLPSYVPFTIISFGGVKFTGDLTFTEEIFNANILYGAQGITSINLPNAKEIINFDLVVDKLTAPNADRIEFYGGAVIKELHVKASVLPSIFNSNVPTNVEKLVVTSGDVLQYESIYGYTSLVDLALPDTIKVIEDGAIGNINIETFDFPKNLEKIESNGISFCDNLKTINVNKNCITIEPGFAYWCNSLENININGNPNFTLDGNILYNDNYTELIFVPSGLELDTYTVRSEVTRIGDAVFYSSKIKEVVLPNGILSIGDDAFANSSLSYIIIPSSVVEIGNYAFSGCELLEGINFDSNNNMLKIGDSAFEYCTSLTSLMLPDSVQTIGDSAFSNCSNLKQLKFPSSYIPSGNYQKLCSNTIYEELTIPSCLFGYGQGETVIINSGETLNFVHDASMFRNIKRLTVGNSIKTIEDGALTFLSKLEFLSLPIGGSIDNMFKSSWGNVSSNLNTLQFTNEDAIDVVSLSTYSGNIKTMIFNGPINKINLSSAKVDSIYYNGGLDNLLQVSTGKIASTDVNIYLDGKLLTDVYINESTNIANGVLYNCKHLNIVEIGEQVETIGSDFLSYANVNKLIINGSYQAFENAGYKFYQATIDYCKIPVSVYNTSNMIINDKLEIYGTEFGSTLKAKPFNGTVVIIDDTVTEFENSAFKQWKNVKELTLPFIGITVNNPKKLYEMFGFTGTNETLETINITNAITLPYECFNLFSNLSKVNLNSGLTTLNDRLFVGTKVTSITIPDTVITIEKNPFIRANYLTEIIVDPNNSQFESLDGVLYNKGLTKLVAFPNAKEELENYDLPETLKTIGSYSFAYCYNVIGINLPKGLDKIENYAFYSCTSIVSLYIYKGNIEIEYNAFNYSYIAVFNENSDLGTFYHEYIEYNYVPNDNSTYKNTYVKVINNVRYYILNDYGYVMPQSNLLSGDIKLNSLFIVNNKQVNVTRIMENAFKDTKVTSITFDIDIENLATHNPFGGCETLKEFKVTSYCYKLKVIDGVLYEGDTLVAYPSGKESSTFALDDKVFMFINPYAFKGCNNLREVFVNNPDKWYYQTEIGFFEQIGNEIMSNPIKASEYLVNNNVQLKYIED